MSRKEEQNFNRKRKQAIRAQNKAHIRSTIDTAKRIKSHSVFVYVDACGEENLPASLPKDIELILITKRHNYIYAGPLNTVKTLHVPSLKLGRMGLVKLALILALSAKYITAEDVVVITVGKSEFSRLDTILTVRLEEESELLTGHSIADIPASILPQVFEQALNIAIELGNKGKEGKPVGTIFVLGDEEKVMQLSKQMIINPFKGYDPEERNLMNPLLTETIREFSSVDGAFVIAGNGEVITAGRYLGAALDDSDVMRGLGSRHISAAGITALTNSVAIVISESSGDVRIFRSGKVIMAIEKPTK